MAESVYKLIDIVGTSTTSWEKAASAAVKTAGKTLRDLRIAEVEKLDMHLEEGKVIAYRARLKVSFKYDPDASTAPMEPAPAPAPKAAKAPKPAPKAAVKKAGRRK